MESFDYVRKAKKLSTMYVNHKPVEAHAFKCYSENKIHLYVKFENRDSFHLLLTPNEASQLQSAMNKAVQELSLNEVHATV